MEEQREKLTLDDLKRIYIRVQDDSGKWVNVSCEEATDRQFDTWIKSRLYIFGDDAPWTPQEKVEACNELWQGGKLHMLKKDIEP